MGDNIADRGKRVEKRMPLWQCPTCQKWVRDPIGIRCHYCTEAARKQTNEYHDEQTADDEEIREDMTSNTWEQYSFNAWPERPHDTWEKS